MADKGYLWDETKYERVLRKHGLTFAHVVEVLEDPNALIDVDPNAHEDRYLLVGQTKQGKVIQVIYSDEALPVIRIITAFGADEFWRIQYER